MKKIFFKIIICFIIFLSLLCTHNVSKADFWKDVVTAADAFYEIGKANSKNVDGASDDGIKEIINDIYNVLLALGVGVTVIVGGVLGIKFMLASAEDKAQLKESMKPYLTGCFVIYGAFGIWKICIQVFSAIF